MSRNPVFWHVRDSSLSHILQRRCLLGFADVCSPENSLTLQTLIDTLPVRCDKDSQYEQMRRMDSLEDNLEITHYQVRTNRDGFCLDSEGHNNQPTSGPEQRTDAYSVHTHMR